MATQRSLSGEIRDAVAAESQIAADAEIARLRAENADLKARYKGALEQVASERSRADSLLNLSGIQSARPVSRRQATKAHPATMMLLISDVHCEEVVRPEHVNNRNEFNLDVCDARLAELQERFFEMLEWERGKADITRLVIWLGGDLITGMIHPELAETNQLHPLAACRWIGERLRRLVDEAATRADEVIVATNSGNHGRTTEKQRTLEADVSYEHNLYLTMAAAERNPNVRWQVSEGHLNYVNLDGFVVRFTHGHSIRYNGGNNGLALPAMKAISAWDAADGRSDLTVFGHYHTFSWLRAARYVSNGSVIGPTAYSVRIKAPNEDPCQGAVVICHRRGEVTRAYPIWCDEDLDQTGDEREQRNGARRIESGGARSTQGRQRSPAGGGESQARAKTAGRGRLPAANGGRNPRRRGGVADR